MKIRSRGRAPIWPHLADELRHSVRRGALAEPLTIAGLAAQWKVSARTMWKAVRALAEEGLLICTRGSRIRLARNAGSPPADASEMRFFETLRSRITDGTYVAGQPLPKVDYFKISEHISPNTVAAACARLRNDGLIHKRGKQWIVGNAPSSAFPAAAARRPIVLLLFPFSREWGPFYEEGYVAPFAHAFTTELQHRGIMLTLAYIDKASEAQAADELPILSGFDEIAAYVKSLGDSYLGALFYSGMGIDPSSAACIDRLLTLGKPIIHFDHNDAQGEWAAQFAARGKKALVRCHPDEQAACRLALETLAAAGHTRIGMPWFTSELARWVPQRCDRLKEAARGMTPSPAILDIEQTEPFWQYTRQNFDLNRYAADIAAALTMAIPKTRGGVARHESLGAQLVKHTPSLRRLLIDRQVTALVALNDLMAREFFLWAQYAGIGIPSGFSMIAFDNLSRCRHFPVTTIDFGLARLGYLAAHVLIGDIPVHADKNACIRGQPILVDRGSVAKPGDRAAVRRLLRIS